jgi:hypothetical protein
MGLDLKLFLFGKELEYDPESFHRCERSLCPLVTTASYSRESYFFWLKITILSQHGLYESFSTWFSNILVMSTGHLKLLQSMSIRLLGLP